MARAARQLYNREELTVYVRVSFPMTTYAAHPQLGRWRRLVFGKENPFCFAFETVLAS